jgi:hypothetical protein
VNTAGRGPSDAAAGGKQDGLRRLEHMAFARDQDGRSRIDT